MRHLHTVLLRTGKYFLEPCFTVRTRYAVILNETKILESRDRDQDQDRHQNVGLQTSLVSRF